MKKTNYPVISVAIQTRETPLMILKRCIQCVRQQTLSGIEIILLDSNDKNSLYKEAIQSEEELLSDIIYLEIPEEKEFVHGKNAVLEAYHGDYLTFLSAQDTMPRKRLEEIVSLFEQDRSISIISTDMRVQQTNVLESPDYAATSQDFQYLSQLVFHRDCFRWIGHFDSDLIAHCDDEMWFRICSLHLEHHISSTNTWVSVCPECYRHYTPLQSAIGYRQLLVKYAPMLCKNKKTKKQLYQKAAFAYQNAGVFHRCIQFKIKAFFCLPSSKAIHSSRDSGI